jgi:hypothetical protein
MKNARLYQRSKQLIFDRISVFKLKIFIHQQGRRPRHAVMLPAHGQAVCCLIFNYRTNNETDKHFHPPTCDAAITLLTTDSAKHYPHNSRHAPQQGAEI